MLTVKTYFDAMGSLFLVWICLTVEVKMHSWNVFLPYHYLVCHMHFHVIECIMRGNIWSWRHIFHVSQMIVDKKGCCLLTFRKWVNLRRLHCLPFLHPVFIGGRNDYMRRCVSMRKLFTHTCVHRCLSYSSQAICENINALDACF